MPVDGGMRVSGFEVALSLLLSDSGARDRNRAPSPAGSEHETGNCLAAAGIVCSPNSGILPRKVSSIALPLECDGLASLSFFRERFSSTKESGDKPPHSKEFLGRHENPEPNSLNVPGP